MLFAHRLPTLTRENEWPKTITEPRVLGPYCRWGERNTNTITTTTTTTRREFHFIYLFELLRYYENMKFY